MIRKILFSLIMAVVTLLVSVTFAGMMFSTPQVYFSHEAYLRGREVCTKVVMHDGEKPCSTLRTIVHYERNWSE